MESGQQTSSMADRRKGCDLHTHTLASDGMNEPSENVRLAYEKGLYAIAITDHDTVSGVQEALEAGKRYGMTVVPGVEISTMAGGKDIHILGYYVDTEDKDFLNRLSNLRNTRNERNEKIILNLQSLGIEITMEEVISGLDRDLKPDESIGRPHIADTLVKKGFASNMRDAFDRYLAHGGLAYAAQPRISPQEACSWIREAGGTPVLAHPGLYDDDGLVSEIIKEAHPSGIEVFHSDHGPEEERRYGAMAEDFGLIVTAGSDYHGERQGAVFHGDIGNRSVPEDVLEKLKTARG
ncbi:PHP domain-containing protein [Paenibacillus sp. N3/727]|uniref:PHP domain-containing protein n=1 Tax=Paenibacillus sp. N3/727 TaxID=2925845 RepID=UPI001F52D683|nr:PHP domain-containing protein [Paenibacillus sp. N3/727]UNK20235.1 PHP domain-containing protein [Paenibacillus sp. N3/727]